MLRLWLLTCANFIDIWTVTLRLSFSLWEKRATAVARGEFSMYTQWDLHIEMRLILLFYELLHWIEFQAASGQIGNRRMVRGFIPRVFFAMFSLVEPQVQGSVRLRIPLVRYLFIGTENRVRVSPRRPVFHWLPTQRSHISLMYGRICCLSVLRLSLPLSCVSPRLNPSLCHFSSSGCYSVWESKGNICKLWDNIWKQ